MRARFIPFALIAALIAALTLGACDSGGSDGDPSSIGPTTPRVTASTTTPVTGSVSITHSGPPHPGTPTVPADVPTTGPNLLKKGEKPPVMPLEATQHTRNGAIAFGKFFIQTIDWAYATTSTTYMRHYFTPGCVTCRSIQKGIDDAAAKHRRFIGDRLSITSVGGVGLTSEHGAEFNMVVAYDVTSVEVVDSRGRFIDGDRALKLKDQLSLRWADGAWTVVYLVGIP